MANRFEALSRGHKALLLGGLLLAFIGVLLLLGEGAVRLRAQLKGTAPIENFYQLDPETGLRVLRAGARSDRLTINQLGFRGPEITQPKPADTTRIAFLGASTTFSAEVSGDAMTWPHLVVERLKQAYPERRFDYVNGAVSGYTLESSQRALESRIAPLEPDLIVIYHATNDLTGHSADAAVRQGLIHARGDKQLSQLAEHSLLWYLLEKNLQILKRQAAAEKPTGKLAVDTAALAAPFRADLTALVRAAKQQAGQVALATFSTHLRRGQTSEAQKEAAVTSLYYMPYMSLAGLLDAFEAYNQVIAEVAESEGVILIEAAEAVPGDPIHFVDSVHFSDAGSKAMADRVFDDLTAAGLF